MGAFDTNNRINEYLIRNLPGEVWRATPPGGKGRQIASMVAHVHNVRLMWLKSATGEVALPAKLEGDEFTKQAAIEALEASHKLVRDCSKVPSTETGGLRDLSRMLRASWGT